MQPRRINMMTSCILLLLLLLHVGRRTTTGEKSMVATCRITTLHITFTRSCLNPVVRLLLNNRNGSPTWLVRVVGIYSSVPVMCVTNLAYVCQTRQHIPIPIVLFQTVDCESKSLIPK